MSATRLVRAKGNAGFTLIETLVAMALTGLILSALATITAQWMPNWNRGFARIQHSESVAIALERISADIGAAEFMRANRDSKSVRFEGSELAVTLLRSSTGPNARPGLEYVHIAETADTNGYTLTRSHAAFTPGNDRLVFTHPVVLLRQPYRVSFSYAGRDRIWNDSWRNANELPAAVMLTVRDVATERRLALSRVAVVHVEAPAESVCAQGDGGCVGSDEKQPQAVDAVAGR
jgi:general secretion pathway protein J